MKRRGVKMRRRTNKIVFDTLIKYKDKLSNSDKQKLLDALKRELIIQRKGIIYLIDAGKGKMTSLANIGSYEFGHDSLRGRKRRPLEIISDTIRHHSVGLSIRDYENLIAEVKK